MPALNSHGEAAEDQVFDCIADALEQQGYIVLPDALPPAFGEALLMRVIDLDESDFRRAGVGRERDFQLNSFVRTDEIRWLSANDAAEASYLAWMERLRLGLNRRLFLGLFDYEAHFARYTRGAFYKRHVDVFRGNTNRVLSTVFYLNPGWTAADGGELLLYGAEHATGALDKVLPLFGTLVVFLSDRFPHEVLTAHRERYSVAGWFRVNNSLGAVIDPPR